MSKSKHEKKKKVKKTNSNVNKPKKVKKENVKKVQKVPKVSKTQKIKNVDDNKKSNKKVKKGKKKNSKLAIVLKIFIVIFLLLCVVGAGVAAGFFFGMFGDEFEISKDELKIGASNSVIVDQNGEVIANLSGDEKRKIITLEDMADYLPKAYVAIEDERFYKHHGVDIKRTGGAILKTVIGKGNFGGSTITQQLVKNVTDEKARDGMAGIMRKVKEWAKAYQVERMISKDQILELYLNILFVGSSNVHGVELGAQYYFNKSAKDLDLAECAFMAGINSSPNSYDPFDETKDNSEKIKKKVITVLAKMKELGYIENEEEYNAAKQKAEAGLTFTKGSIGTGVTYSYHTDAVIEQVVQQVMKEKQITRQLAENYVYSSGLTIYSTVNKSIQTRLEEEYKKEKYIKPGKDLKADGTKKNDHTQSGMAVIDYRTGNVLGVAGGLGEKKGTGWNRATQMIKQTGSSIKPIADVAPALEEGIITPATVYDDAKTDFGNYTPKNDHNSYRGVINIRQFIETSQNIPALKIMRELTPEKSIEYLQKMGVTSLDPEKDAILSTGIGGMTTGISPLEMAVAYGTIANGGVCIAPTFYTKVVDSSGNIVLLPNQEQTRAVSEQTAYLTTSIVQEPVKGGSGTATYCKIPGMDVAAKTGTTDNSNDRWLCGFTPYYAAATWFGYDDSEEVTGFGQNPAGQIWDAVMTDIHKGLENATFTRPSGIVEYTACRLSGGLATTGCTSTYREIFDQNHIPEKCGGHGSQTICVESGKVATEFCSQYGEVKDRVYGASIPKEKLNLWKPLAGRSISGPKIEETCDIHTGPKVEEKVVEKPVEQPEEKPIERPIESPTEKPAENTSSGGNTSDNKNQNKTETTDKKDEDKKAAQ